MAGIQRSELEIDRVDPENNQRRLRVSYDLRIPAGDGAVGEELIEEIVVHGISVEDGLSKANSHPIIVHQASFVAAAGTEHRVFERIVHRKDLDVEEDWWRAGQGGETQVIAEWVDHVVADIRIEREGAILDQVTTAVVSGSWGVLGDD